MFRRISTRKYKALITQSCFTARFIFSPAQMITGFDHFNIVLRGKNRNRSIGSIQVPFVNGNK